MKKLLYIASLLAFSSCANQSAEEKAKEAVSAFFTATIAAPRTYTPIESKVIAAPAREQGEPVGQTWLVHHYALTDAAGNKQERNDTLVVESSGKVLFY